MRSREPVTTISQEDSALINATPFLQSLLYDFDLLPEQLLSQTNFTEGLVRAWARLEGIMICYKAMKEVENAEA